MMLLVFIAIFLTLISLIAGIVIMGKGGIINSKYSTKLMSMRVGFQALAIILIFLIYYIKQ
jgi:hypothetical protein